MTPLVPRAFRRVPTRRTPPKVRGRRRPLSVQDLDERIVPSAPPAPLGFTSTLTSFTNNTAVSITSTGTPTVTSTINVSGVGTYLHDLDLTTFLKHTFPGDLDITLTSPAGTIVTITSDNGASNDDVFNGTLWDDDADPGNPAPFPGDTFPGSFLATDTAYTLGILKPALTPEEPLSAFRGENPNGTWTLTVSDDANADGGSLDQWTLGVSTLNASPTAQAPATFTNSTAAPISATGTPTVTSSIVVSGAPLSLQKLTLRTFITHTNASNLDITLTSPSGTSVTLTSDNGGTNDDVFNGTLWDDDADPGNPAPFPPSNTFAASNMVTDTTYTNLTVKATLTPEESLAAFIGENPNGTWTLTVSDDTNSDGGSLASWELGITGFELGPIPAAIATSPGVTTGGGTSHPVTVTFVDDSGINVATVIGNNAALQVNGPNGFSAPLTYVSIDNSGNGSPRVATYSFTPPGGSWDGIDSGTYTISVLANQVADVDGGFIPAGSVGSFVVAIPNFTVFNDADSGFGSLRQVIGDANAVPGPDTIVFDPGFFNTPRTISLLSALPTIVGPLTIPGTGAANLTVRRDPSASGNFRVFDSTASALTISGMTISGGNAATGGGLQANAAGTTINLSGVTFTGNTATTNGGALHVTGTNANVTVINSLFDTNTVTGTGNGGAVFMNSGTFLTVRNSTLSGNTAAADGGALYFFSGGGLTVENSTISGNTASGTVVGGGALYFFGTASSSPPAGAGFTPGTVVIRNSTLANNNSAANGGAVAMPSFAGTLLLQNSTLTGNTAALSGGAAVVTTGSGSIVVQGSTVVNNTSNASAANTGGGGVARISTTPGSITVVNSVVSGNINANGPDILSVTGTTVNANFSAIGSNTGFTLSGTSGNNLAFGVDPQLGALANNGGPTQTMAPAAGSPLINAGSIGLVPGITVDQRATGFVRAVGAETDIGAFEVQATGFPAASATGPTVTTPGETSYTFTVTFYDTTGSNNGINVASVVDNHNAVRVTGPNGFDAPATFVSINNPTNGAPRTATYSITPPGGAWEPAARGNYLIRVQADQVADADGNFVPAGPVGAFTVFIFNDIVFNADDSGFGSLRQVISDANITPGADTITFDPAFFNTQRVISLLTPLPQILAAGGALTVNGPGASMLTVRRDPAAATNFGILNSLAPTLNLNGLTISGGRSDADGGGLLAGGTITLDGVVFTDNTAVQEGGAIFTNSGAFLMLRNSTISGNTATTTGGGLYMVGGGGLVIDTSSIAGNAANGTAGGGALRFSGTPSASPPAGFTASTLVIRNSTLSGNTSAADGGAILLPTLTGTLLLRNSTLAGNTAAISGGAVAQVAGSGSIRLENSTVFGNTANGSAANSGGGGLSRISATAGTITVANSIVSGNTNGNAPDILTGATGTTVNVNFSAVGSNTGFTLSGTSGNNLNFGANLQLAALGAYGGPTPTMAPLAGSNSPLINAGSNALVAAGVTTDQRGATFDRIFDTTVDIGAYEVQPPKVTVNQASFQSDPTNVASIIYTVAFNVPVSGFNNADIDFTGSTAGGNLGAFVPVFGPAVYTVTVIGMTSDGTVVISVPAGAALDQFNAGNLASTSTDNSVTYDATPPTVTINQAAGQADPTNTAPITFTVHFSEPVVGFSASDINFTGSTVGGTLVANVSGSGADYTVLVTGMDGTGTVVARIPAAAATDLAGNSSAASTSTDNLVNFDNQSPSVTIDRAAGQADPTNAAPIKFAVHFSEPVTGFDATDVSLAGSTVGGTLVAEVTGSGADFTVSVTGMSGVGTVVASIPAGASTDPAGNQSLASTSTDNEVGFDDVAPTVTIDQAAGQPDPTSDPSVSFTVHFSELVTTFTGSAVSFAGSTVGGTLVASVSGSGADYTVSVTGMVGEGLLVASIPAGAITDPAGNPNAASTSTDNEVAIFSGGQLQFSSAVYTATETGGSVSVTVNRVNGVTGAVSVDFASSAGTATPGANGDYEDVSGTLNWADGDSSPRTFVITLHDDRLVEGTETVNLALSNPVGIDVELGTPSTAVLAIADLEEGLIQFSAPVFNVAEDGVQATVTVTRTNGSAGAVTVQYATADGSAHTGSDFTNTLGQLTWANGETANKTIIIPIANDLANEGKELINLSLSNPTGNATLGLAATQVAIAASDPVGPGTFFDDDGDKVIAKVVGTATMDIYRTDPDGDGRGPIELMVLTNNQPDPLLQKPITVNLSVVKPRTGSDGRVGLGTVTGTGLKTLTLNARAFNLNGDGVLLDGPLTAVNVGDIQNGADIVALGTPAQKTRITAGVIGDGTSIDLGSSVSALAATRFGAGSVTAPSIGALTIRGNARQAIAGDLGASVTLSGAGLLAGKMALNSLSVAGALGADIVAPSIGTLVVKGNLTADVTVTGVGVTPGLPALRALRVTGSILGSEIDVTGIVTAVSAKSFVGGSLHASSVGTILIKGDMTADISISGDGVLSGKPALRALTVQGTVDDSFIFVGGNVTNVTATAFRDSQLHVGYTGPENGSGTFTFATLNSFRVLGATDAYQNSTAIAFAIKTVFLRSVDTTNGGNPFGVIADDSIGSLRVVTPAFTWNALNPPPPLGDFEVKIV